MQLLLVHQSRYGLVENHLCFCFRDQWTRSVAIVQDRTASVWSYFSQIYFPGSLTAVMRARISRLGPGHKDSFGSAKSSRAMRYLWRGDPDQSRGLAVSTHCGGEAWNENLEQIRSEKPSRNWRDKRGPGYPAYYVCLPSWQPEQYLRDEKVFKLRKYLSCKNKWGQFRAGWHRMKDEKMNVGC